MVDLVLLQLSILMAYARPEALHNILITPHVDFLSFSRQHLHRQQSLSSRNSFHLHVYFVTLSTMTSTFGYARLGEPSSSNSTKTSLFSTSTSSSSSTSPSQAVTPITLSAVSNYYEELNQTVEGLDKIIKEQIAVEAQYSLVYSLLQTKAAKEAERDDVLRKLRRMHEQGLA